MDDEWLKRLADRESPGVCVLTDYIKLTRLLSGVSASGWTRLAHRAAQLQAEQKVRSKVLGNPDVIGFLDLLKGLNDDEKIIVLDVIRRGLFPNDPDVPMFRAASIDPLAQPHAATQAARSEISELEQRLSAMTVPVQSRGQCGWEAGASFDPDAFLLVTCGVTVTKDTEIKQEPGRDERDDIVCAGTEISEGSGGSGETTTPAWETKVYINEEPLCQITLKAAECSDGAMLRKIVIEKFNKLHFGDAPMLDAAGRLVESNDLQKDFPKGAVFSIRLGLDTQLLHADITDLCQEFPNFRLFALAREESLKVETVVETFIWTVQILFDDIKLETYMCELPEDGTGKDLKDKLYDTFQDLLRSKDGVLTCGNEVLKTDIVLAKALTRDQVFRLQFRGPFHNLTDHELWIKRYPLLSKFDVSLRPQENKTFLYSVYIGDVLACSSSIKTPDDVTVEDFAKNVLKGISSLLSTASTKVQLAVTELWLASKDVLSDCLAPEDDLDLRIFLDPQEVKSLVPEDRLPLLFHEVPTKELNKVFGMSFLNTRSEIEGGTDAASTGQQRKPPVTGSGDDALPRPKRRPTLGVPEPANPPRSSQASHVAKRFKVDNKKVKYVSWYPIGTLHEESNRTFSLLVRDFNHEAGGYRPYVFSWVVTRSGSDPIQFHGENFPQVLFNIAGAYRLLLHGKVAWTLRQTDLDWNEDSRTLTFFL